MTGISSFTKRRKSRATWSFRLRAVCSRLPVARSLSEQDLHVHVDVLAVLGEFHLSLLDFLEKDLQGLHDLFRLFLGDDPLLPQHGGVGDGAGDVLPVEPGVEGNGGVKVVDLVVGFLLEPASP